jgi:hypothetical protein
MPLAGVMGATQKGHLALHAREPATMLKVKTFIEFSFAVAFFVTGNSAEKALEPSFEA